MTDGVEYDSDVVEGLDWLASTQGDKPSFYQRLEEAQNSYISATSSAINFGKPFDPAWHGQDIVAGFLSQAKSLIDNRRAYDVSVASHIIPWVKRLGQCAQILKTIHGAEERARRMLSKSTVSPDTALFELVLASNYASEGCEVEFVPEKKGIEKTPEFKCTTDSGDCFFVECKKLQKGPYATTEKEAHDLRANLTRTSIMSEKMNIWISVSYRCEVKNSPEEYLHSHLKEFSGMPYSWDDKYGTGFIRAYDFSLIKKDISDNGSLLFNIKLARIIKGSALDDENYNLFASGEPDERDARYATSISNASLITWRCVNDKSVEAKSRHVTKILSEIDDQLLGYGFGVGHVAMDADIQKDVADRRREKNYEAVINFKTNSEIVRLNIHYLVPRITENSSWMVDETVDDFYSRSWVENVIPLVRAFPGVKLFENDLPGWHQNSLSL